MSVSVVLATYNGERYLAAQLDSLVAQSRMPDELVVSDDASTDHTKDILNDFSKSSPFPVTLTLNANRIGYADNFLSAARLASGDHLAFCDQDDVWHVSKLERITGEFDHRAGVLLVAHHAQVVDSTGRPLGRSFPRPVQAGHYASGQAPLTHYPGLTITIRSCVLTFADPAARPDNGDPRAGLMGHDQWLWMIAACTGTVTVIPDILVSYRQHENTFGENYLTLRERLRRAWATGASTYRSRAASALTLASYLDTLGTQWAENGERMWAANAFDRASQYRLQAYDVSRREQLYSASTRRRALRTWARMVCSGEYDLRYSWRESVLSVGKDAARALFGWWPSHSDEGPHSRGLSASRPYERGPGTHVTHEST